PRTTSPPIPSAPLTIEAARAPTFRRSSLDALEVVPAMQAPRGDGRAGSAAMLRFPHIHLNESGGSPFHGGETDHFHSAAPAFGLRHLTADRENVDTRQSRPTNRQENPVPTGRRIDDQQRGPGSAATAAALPDRP